MVTINEFPVLRDYAETGQPPARAGVTRRIHCWNAASTSARRLRVGWWISNGFTPIDLADLHPVFPRMRQDTRYHEYVLQGGRQ
jgi:hypothetical protein